jgi:predicted amidohydrolase YtcJ
MATSESVVDALAVSRNRITAVGTNKQISKLIGPSTRVIDAKGRLVLPGFNDSHVHFMAIGNTFSSLDLRDVRSAGEMLARIARYVRFLPKGRWILGGHFKDEDWELPDRRSIDAIAPDNPVFLYRSGATTAYANSKAFKLADLKDDATDVDRNAAGEVTGIIRGSALKRIASTVPANHTTNWLEVGETATNYAAALGVTSVQDMHSDDSRETFRELERRGKLKTRVYDCVPLRDWKKLRETRLANEPGAMVRDGCLKSFSDGDEESKGGLLREITAADKAGLQIMIHAIGNSANRIVLDVFEQTARLNGARERRFRVEHAHNAHTADLARFSRSNIIPSMQPYLFRGSEGSRYRVLLRQGAKLAFGSDASMVDLDPLAGIHAALTGPEPISVYEAVRAYTLGSAYAEFQEKQKGTIESGKLADFVILSDDIFTIDHSKLKEVKVLITIVDGKVVYQTD